MAITISAHVLARIDAVAESNDHPNADALLDQLLAPLETGTIDSKMRDLLQIGIDEMEQGETLPLTDELLRSARREAARRYLAGERPSADVCP